MFFSPNFKKQMQNVQAGGALLLPRPGVIKTVAIPKVLENAPTVEADIQEDPNGAPYITFDANGTVQILADEFGIAGTVQPLSKEDIAEFNDDITELGESVLLDSGALVVHGKKGRPHAINASIKVFFVQGGAVIELLEGEIMLRGSNGQPFLVNSAGVVSQPYQGVAVKWTSAAELYAHCLMISQSYYGLSQETVMEYVNNLLFHYTLALEVNGTYSIRLIERYDDIALGQISFATSHDVNMMNESDDDIVGFDPDSEDFVDVDDEEEKEYEELFEDEDADPYEVNSKNF